MRRSSTHHGSGGVGLAIPAVLALLAAVGMLVLAYAALTMANWLAARNLRDGAHAWAMAESATAAVVEELRETHQRIGELPDAYAFAAAATIGVSVAYTKTGPATAAVDVVARGRHVAAHRVAELDMTR